MSTCRHKKKKALGWFQVPRRKRPQGECWDTTIKVRREGNWKGAEIRKAAGCGDQWRKWRMEQGVANCQTCWSQIDPCHLPQPKASLCHRLICNFSHCLFLYFLVVKFCLLSDTVYLVLFIPEYMLPFFLYLCYTGFYKTQSKSRT